MYSVTRVTNPPVSVGVASGRVIALSKARRGDCGVVVGVGRSMTLGDAGVANGITRDELEQRLLEIGFVEGARIKVLHEGPFGRDPLAVKVDDTRIALRRREAADVMIELDPDGGQR